MAVEKVLKWDHARKTFEPLFIDAELLERSDVAIPMEVVEPITITPDDRIDLVREDTGSSTRARWRVQIKDSFLHSPTFVTRSSDPIEVKIDVRPVDRGAAVSAVIAGPVTRSRICVVRIELPKPRLHWRGPPYRQDDALIEIEADAEHDFRIYTWVETFAPDAPASSATITPKNDHVEFTHKTEAGFDPRLFGPHPEDRPWVVARAGSANNRQVSRWISKAALPDPRHPDLTLPKHFTISTKVWPRGAITERRVNEVSWRKDPLLEQHIPCALVPVALAVEMLRTAPFLADGDAIGVAFRAMRARDHRPVHRGTIRWELKADTALGGRTDTTSVTLTEADEGRFGLVYTPPELVYRPGGRYHEHLVFYQGDGASRIDIATIPLLLRPAIKATLRASKRGLATREPGRVELGPAESAAELKGALRYAYENFDPYRQDSAQLAFATLDISCDDQPAQSAVTSDADGAFTWKLPELDEVFAAVPELRSRDLDESTMPTIKLADEAAGALEMYETRLRTLAPLGLLTPTTADALKCYGLEFCEQLAVREVADYERIIAACDLLRVTTASAGSWQSIHKNAFERSVTDVVNFLSDLAATAISVFEVGHLLVQGVGQFVEFVTRNTTPILKILAEDLAAKLKYFGAQLLEGMSALVAGVPENLRSIAQSALKSGKHAIDALFQIFGQADRGDWGSNIAREIGEALTNLFKFLGETIWTLGKLTIWFAFGSIRLVLTSTAGVAEWLFRPVSKQTSDFFRLALASEVSKEEARWSLFALDKLGEIAFSETLTRSEVLKDAGMPRATFLQQQLDLWPALLANAVDGNLAKARALQVPTAATSRIDDYDAEFRAANGASQTLHSAHYTIDRLSAAADLAVLVVEVGFVLLGSMATSGALSAAAYGKAASNLEIGIGAVKTMTRAAQWGASMGVGIYAQWGFHSATTNLMAMTPP